MAPAVERIDLAGDVSIARVLIGLWQIADMERDGRAFDLTAAAEAMGPYADAGLTTFDMADHYGSAEDVAGLFATTQPGGAIQLCTKWVPKPGRVRREDVRSAVQHSLDRLRTDRIDLMQFHAWRFADPAWLDALFYLKELRDEGLIRAVGTTNFDTAHLRIALASGIPIASNQISYSLIDRRASGPMATLCAQYGVRILAYGTVAASFTIESFSLDRLASLTRPELDARYDEFARMVRI